MDISEQKNEMLVRIWPDGDYQLAEEPAFDWKSDDYKIIDLYKFNEGQEIDQDFFMAIANDLIGPDPASE